jgi:hypothetical protein
MPSLVPLNNTIAQNSLDFNNQNPTNKGGLLRYKINDYTRVNYGSVGQHYFTNADLNSVCIFSGDVNIILSSGYLNPAPLTGSEILFYSAAGRIRLDTSGFSLYSNVGNFTVPTKAGKIIYTSGNTWYFSSLNTDVFTLNVTDCCSISAGNIYQVGNNNSGSLDANVKIYADANVTVPFNGIVYDNLSERYNVINGLASVISDCDSPAYYNVEYTFYTEDIIYPGEVTPITFYSKPGAGTPNNYGTLLGNKFFTTIPSENQIYSCYSYSTVAPGSSATYYGDGTQYPSSPVTFLNGYVIDYSGIPYMGSPI